MGFVSPHLWGLSPAPLKSEGAEQVIAGYQRGRARFAP